MGRELIRTVGKIRRTFRIDTRLALGRERRADGLIGLRAVRYSLRAFRQCACGRTFRLERRANGQELFRAIRSCLRALGRER